MAEPEDFAIQRDRGFVVKLVVALVLASAFGLWVAGHIASPSTSRAAAGVFEQVTTPR